MLGDAPGGEGGARRRRRAVRRVLDERGLRSVHPQGQGRRPDDDRTDRREPLGLRGEQARVRAPVVRALQGRRPAAGDRPAVQRLRPAAGGRRRDPRHHPAGAAARCRSRSSTTARRSARGATSTTSSTACCAARSRPEAVGHAFNLGNPQGTITNFELANMIIRLTQSKSEIVFKPHPGPEVDLRVPSIEKAATLLGFKPTVSLEAGISRTIPWYREHLAAALASLSECASSSPARRVSSAATCCCARRATGRSSPSITARPGSTRSSPSRADARPRRALRSDEPGVGGGARRHERSLDACCISRRTAIRRRRPSDRRGISRSNTLSLVTLLEHVRVGHVVYVSSGAVYDGLRRSGLAGDRRSRPLLPYAISKLASEQYVRFFAERRHAIGSYINVRFFGAYGPYEAAPQDHDALDARGHGRPARVHAARRRREPDRLHVRGRRGRRVPDADGVRRIQRRRSTSRRARRSASTPSSQAMAQALGVDVTTRHDGHTEEYIRFRTVDTTMRERFGVAPSISVRRRRAAAARRSC